jgi:hypothetical protein
MIGLFPVGTVYPDPSNQFNLINPHNMALAGTLITFPPNPINNPARTKNPSNPSTNSASKETSPNKPLPAPLHAQASASVPSPSPALLPQLSSSAICTPQELAQISAKYRPMVPWLRLREKPLSARLCCVCEQPANSPLNPLLACGGKCLLSFHRECFGVEMNDLISARSQGLIFFCSEMCKSHDPVTAEWCIKNIKKSRKRFRHRVRELAAAHYKNASKNNNINNNGSAVSVIQGSDAPAQALKLLQQTLQYKRRNNQLNNDIGASPSLLKTLLNPNKPSKAQNNSNKQRKSSKINKTPLNSLNNTANHAVSPNHNKARRTTGGKRNSTAPSNSRRCNLAASSDSSEHLLSFRCESRDPDEAFCCVCEGGESTEENVIILCDGPCLLSYHQYCAGVQRVPEGNFYCSEMCTSMKKSQQFLPEEVAIKIIREHRESYKVRGPYQDSIDCERRRCATALAEIDSNYFCPQNLFNPQQLNQLQLTQIDEIQLARVLNLISETAVAGLHFETEEEETAEPMAEEIEINEKNGISSSLHKEQEAVIEIERQEIKALHLSNEARNAARSSNYNDAQAMEVDRSNLVANVEKVVDLVDWIDISVDINSAGDVSVAFELLSEQSRTERAQQFLSSIAPLDEMELLLAAYYTQVIANNEIRRCLLNSVEQCSSAPAQLAVSHAEYSSLQQYFDYENEHQLGEQFERARKKEKSFISKCMCNSCVKASNPKPANPQAVIFADDSTAPLATAVQQMAVENNIDSAHNINTARNNSTGEYNSEVEAFSLSMPHTALAIKSHQMNFSRLSSAIQKYAPLPVVERQITKPQPLRYLNPAESLAVTRGRRQLRQTQSFSPEPNTVASEFYQYCTKTQRYYLSTASCSPNGSKTPKTPRSSLSDNANNNQSIALKALKTPNNAYKASKWAQSYNTYVTPSPYCKTGRKVSQSRFSDANLLKNNNHKARADSPNRPQMELSPLHDFSNHLSNSSELINRADISVLNNSAEVGEPIDVDKELNAPTTKAIKSLMSWGWDKSVRAADKAKLLAVVKSQELYSNKIQVDGNGNPVRTLRVRNNNFYYEESNNGGSSSSNQPRRSSNSAELNEYEVEEEEQAAEEPFDFEHHIDQTVRRSSSCSNSRAQQGIILKAELLANYDGEKLRMKITERLSVRRSSARKPQIVKFQSGERMEQELALSIVEERVKKEKPLEAVIEPQYRIYTSRSGRSCRRLISPSENGELQIDEDTLSLSAFLNSNNGSSSYTNNNVNSNKSAAKKAPAKETTDEAAIRAGSPSSHSHTKFKVRYKLNKSQYEPSVEEEACGICGSTGDLILCDGHIGGKACPRAYHTRCVHLTKVPRGEYWCPRHYCQDCKNYPNTHIYCFWCTNSYCDKHVGALRERVPWIPEPKKASAEYIICPECIDYFLKKDRVDLREPLRQIQAAETLINQHLAIAKGETPPPVSRSKQKQQQKGNNKRGRPQRVSGKIHKKSKKSEAAGENDTDDAETLENNNVSNQNNEDGNTDNYENNENNEDSNSATNEEMQENNAPLEEVEPVTPSPAEYFPSNISNAYTERESLLSSDSLALPTASPSFLGSLLSSSAAQQRRSKSEDIDSGPDHTNYTQISKKKGSAALSGGEREEFSQNNAKNCIGESKSYLHSAISLDSEGLESVEMLNYTKSLHSAVAGGLLIASGTSSDNSPKSTPSNSPAIQPVSLAELTANTDSVDSYGSIHSYTTLSSENNGTESPDKARDASLFSNKYSSKRKSNRLN